MSGAFEATFQAWEQSLTLASLHPTAKPCPLLAATSWKDSAIVRYYR